MSRQLSPVRHAPEPHHDHPLTPVESEDLPEAEIGRKVEKVAERPHSRPEPEPEAEVEPEAARKPASVGKSGAQSDTDDLR